MFPTPPSMEAHAQASPGFSLPDDATPLRHHLAPPHGSPPPDTPIEVQLADLYLLPLFLQFKLTGTISKDIRSETDDWTGSPKYRGISM